MVDQASSTLESAELAEVESATPQPATPQPAGAVADEGLMGELARAMHQAATAQYERQNAELERRRTEQVEAIARRADADADGLKAASEADVASIDAWAKAETEKIKHERLRRIEERRERLATQLHQRATIREREVAAIEAAIGAHRQEVDQFFGRMERETDPAAIAQVAATIPAFPPLEEVAEAARTRAAAELEAPEAPETPARDGDAEATVGDSPLMAVMDPQATRQDAPTERPWEAPHAVSVAAGSGPGSPEPSSTTAAPAAEHGSRVGSTLLRTVRAIRPVGGEGRDAPGSEG